MNRRNVTMLTAALLLIGGGGYYANSISDHAQAPAKKNIPRKILPGSIQLEITIDGGFAYIPAGNTLNIAYLNSFKYADPLSRGDKGPAVETYACNVEQIGTDLLVTDGIVEPSSGQTTYDLDETVVTFPALASSSATLSATRGARPGSPFTPTNTANPTQWEDLRYIPSLLAEHGAKLNPKWKELVNGFMVLKGGRLKGVRPERYANHTFDFKRGGVHQFEQAITDRTVYSVTIPGDRVEIALDAEDGPDRLIVVKPSGSSRVVKLMLHGKHDQNKKTPPVNGSPLSEHCTFYQLFDPVPPPQFWLKPYVKAPSEAPGAKPRTPGFFCPGDWF